MCTDRDLPFQYLTQRPGWGPRVCISNRFSGAAAMLGPLTATAENFFFFLFFLSVKDRFSLVKTNFGQERSLLQTRSIDWF